MAKMQRRKGKNNWEVCYPLPAKLRAILKTPALNRSLGTPDKAEARRLYPMKLAMVQAEVAALLAKHFQDDDAQLSELRNLLRAWKQAADDGDPDKISEKDILTEIIKDWGEEQRRQRIRTFKQTEEYRATKSIPPSVKTSASRIAKKAEVVIDEALDERWKIAVLVGHWRAEVKPRHSQSTQEEYERAVIRFTRWCEQKRYVALDQIDRKAVRAFVADCYHGKLGRTVKLALGALRGVWDHAYRLGWLEEKSRVWLDHDFADKVRVGTGERKAEDDAELPFSLDDIRVLLSRLTPQPFCDLLRIAFITGARSSEVAALRCEHVEKRDDGIWLTLPGTKTASARKRMVPVPVAFEPLIERVCANSKDDYLLPLYVGKEWATERDRNRYINKEVNRKRRDLGLPDQDNQGVHSARRTFVELMEGAGVPLDTIKLLVGHKRTDITLGRYSAGTYVNLRAAMEKLAYPADIVGLINAADI